MILQFQSKKLKNYDDEFFLQRAESSLLMRNAKLKSNYFGDII